MLCAAALTTAAVLTWRRTRLPFATAGMACVAVASVMLVGLNLAGYPWPSTAAGPFNLPLPWEIAVLARILAAPVTVFTEARVHRSAWLQWSRHMENQGLWDLLRFRHIPVLLRGLERPPEA